MKIEEAYSLDYCDVIDPEKAYELFWEGVIKDKRNFICPFPGCNAQITCSNIDKLKSAMRNVVHFRAYGEHIESCDYIEEIEDAIYISEESDRVGQCRATNNSTTDIFEYDRPESHKIVKQKDEDIINHEEIKKLIRKRRIDSDNQIQRSSTYHSLKPIVSKYLGFKEKNLLDRRFINIKGYNVSYSKMFIDIDSSTFNDFDKYMRIYYGIATIKKNPKDGNGYIIRFKNNVHYKNSAYISSIFLTNKTIEKCYFSNMWIRDIEIFINEEFCVFIHTKPVVNGKYINFPLSKMEFLELREI